MYKLVVKPLPLDCAEIERWCLDYPRNEDALSLDTLQKHGIQFQGWVLSQGSNALRSYVKNGREKHFLDLNRSRPDVVSKILKASPDGHPSVKCGFRTGVPVFSDEVYFGFEINGCDFDAIEIRIEGALRILQGADGWLYLDNDTNQSVEQYRGKFLLGRNEVADWRYYLNSLNALAHRDGFKHVVLIAPTKEMVLPDYYPYSKGKQTPVDQIQNVASDEHHLVHPVAELAAMEESPFRKCDTHWSHKGALTGLMVCLGHLGFDSDVIHEFFSKDIYYTAQRSGDLGNKLYPPQSAPELLLKGMPYKKWMVYDNNLPNLGRVIVFHNEQALMEGKCLIFGSSSSYSFFSYVARVFSTVIFVHSAGGIDSNLVTVEKPDYLIAQTNGRFVVRPPSISYDLTEDMRNKLGSLSEHQVSELRKREEATSPLPNGVINSDLPLAFSRLLHSTA